MRQDPWWIWIAVPVGLAIVVLLSALLGRLLRRAGIGTHERSSRAGAAALHLQSMLEPSKRHVLQVRQRERRETEGQGDGDDNTKE